MNSSKVFSLWRDQSGSVMVEAVIIIPVLLTLTFAIIQVGVLLFLLNSISHVTFDVARAVAVGQLDDEGNGQWLDCTNVSGGTNSGKPSAEAYMCEQIGTIGGTFMVSVNDGEATDIAPAGNLIAAQLRVTNSPILFFDPTDAFVGMDLLQASAVQVKEKSFASVDGGENE
jgi:hypothetical protein